MKPEHSDPTWRDTLVAGDIVSFAFPSTENDAGLEKHRPALILTVDRSGPVPLADVVYGTASTSGANRGLELHVTEPAQMLAAHLHKPTRFVGTRMIRVPLDSERFVVCAAGTAVLGQLPAELHPRLDRLRAIAGGSPSRIRGGLYRRRGRRFRHAACPFDLASQSGFPVSGCKRGMHAANHSLSGSTRPRSTAASGATTSKRIALSLDRLAERQDEAASAL